MGDGSRSSRARWVFVLVLMGLATALDLCAVGVLMVSAEKFEATRFLTMSESWESINRR